jgi:hypothetical protein
MARVEVDAEVQSRENFLFVETKPTAKYAVFPQVVAGGEAFRIEFP